MLRWLAAIPVVLVSSTARADQEPSVAWNESWRRFEWYDYAGSAAFLGGAIGVSFTPFPDDGHRGGLFFDEAVRDAFLAGSRRGRDRAQVIGDMFFRGMILYPYLVDTLLVSWIAHGSGDVAAQMFLINTEAQAVGTFLTLSSEHLIGRARPSTDACEIDPQHERFCGGGDRFASFVSGHTATAATSAGLMCAHHGKLPLYGGGAPDMVACIAGIGGAATVGIARIVNDRHWASDVLAGGAIGAFAGYVLPNWLHYGFGETRTDVGKIRWTVTPTASSDQWGAQWVGTF